MSQARNMARKVLADLATGINPNARRQQRIIEERKVKQLEAARNITLQQALEECLALKDYPALSANDEFKFRSSFVEFFKASCGLDQ